MNKPLLLKVLLMVFLGPPENRGRRDFGDNRVVQPPRCIERFHRGLGAVFHQVERNSDRRMDASRIEESLRLLDALERLPTDQATAVRMRYLECRSIAEIGDEFGVDEARGDDVGRDRPRARNIQRDTVR